MNYITQLPDMLDARQLINMQHVSNGVKIIDTSATYIDEAVEIAFGVVIYPGVILEGCTKIGEGAVIGANSHLRDTIVEKGAYIHHSVAIGAYIGENTEVGPFAYLRPNTNLADYCKVGSFVEVKNANVKSKSKIPHLSYVGDADIGTGVNIGCGVITANYDGKNKHRTVIGNDVFVGSNSNLIAPVTLGDEAFVAAGSTITKDVSSGALGIARARQEERTDWVRPKKKDE